MKEITFNKDQVIFRQGEFGTAMYDVLSGEIGIYTDYQGADEKQIAVIKAVRELTSLGLAEAKGLVDGAPKAVKENVSKEECDKAAEALKAAGAEIEIK